MTSQTVHLNENHWKPATGEAQTTSQQLLPNFAMKRGVRRHQLNVKVAFCGAFIVYWSLKALYNTCHTHPLLHWWQRLPRWAPTARREQFGVQYLAHGHFDTQLRVAGIWTSDPPITEQPALPPELQPATIFNGDLTRLYLSFLQLWYSYNPSVKKKKRLFSTCTH